MIVGATKRPRNVNAPRAAAILYGDWGTSKAYVIGLAFAVAGYSSFWLILPMCVLTALIGINYISICKHYPDGGGVYASVRHRSEIISIVGAFLLIADYIVTAAISALSAFQYLGVSEPEKYAAISIACIGLLNYFGPKHTGGLAFLISFPTVIVVVLLGIFCLPHLGDAWRHVEPLKGNFLTTWNGFVGIVLALSGVEAIANTTGVMKLDPNSTEKKLSVSRTSTPAIIWVMIEVCVFTALLGLGMHALRGLQMSDGDVNAPGHSGVRDYMLRYMAEVFVGGSLGPVLGHLAGWTVTVVMGLLLFSATNTAIVDLIAIQFLLSRDKEIPRHFQKLNFFGVPTLAMICATIIPVALVLFVKDMASLADLYAVGVVGAIATNLGSTSTDRKLSLMRWERILMFCTFLIMLFIEISLLVDKPHARVFAVTVLAVGLILRGLVHEHANKKEISSSNASLVSSGKKVSLSHVKKSPIVCAARKSGRTVDFAIRQALESERPLYILFVREQPTMTEKDRSRSWESDEEARQIFSYATEKAGTLKVVPCYAISDAPADTIADVVATVGASCLILGASQRSALITLLRGNITQEVSKILPESIDLILYA
jgi:amino acid transporter/nucleotide-binding universal stress UspA family protein